MDLQTWELLSYMVTVIGLPFALIAFYMQQRKERQNEEAEIYQSLSDEYADFQRLLLRNADLQLTLPTNIDNLTPDQRERKKIIFDILISLFERAFILVYEENMSKQTARLWASWEDYIRSWCSRKDFRDALPELLPGEDPDFEDYIRKLLQKIP